MIGSRRDLGHVRRVVVKIGSALLADATHGVRKKTIAALAHDIAELRGRGIEVLLVSSGAVALGRVYLGWLGKKLSLHEKQAAAAVGQPKLMRAYEEAFSAHGIHTAQLLLTKDDLRHRRRYLNASNTAATLFGSGILPIVNENDTVVVDEIKFGDNDTLGALVSLLVDADLNVILTDVDGLYEHNPRTDPSARRISLVGEITREVLAMVGDVGTPFGTGGMGSKLRAARIATRGGTSLAIIDGHGAGALQALLAADDVGTLFLCGTDRRTRRHHWIADVLVPRGRLHVDAGAAKALRLHGKSLLPVGIVAVDGVFKTGACVEIVGPDGPVAKGLCNYDAEDLRKILGVPSSRIEAMLGYADHSSAVHRNNMVLLETGDDSR